MPFDHDRALAAHLASLQPSTPPRRHQTRKVFTVGSHQGTCCHYDEVRNFGFITMSDGRDVFVAGPILKDCGIKRLVKGDRVSFDLVESKKYPGKMQASNISILLDEQKAA
jgi:cold shock CspA family protein